MRYFRFFLAALTAAFLFTPGAANADAPGTTTTATTPQKQQVATSNPFEVRDPGLKEAIETANKALSLARGWRAGDASLGARIEALEAAQRELALLFGRGLVPSDQAALKAIYAEITATKVRLQALEDTVYGNHAPRISALEAHEFSLAVGVHAGLVGRKPIPNVTGMFVPSLGLDLGISDDIPAMGWSLTGGLGANLARGIDTDLTLAIYGRRKLDDGSWSALAIGGYAGAYYNQFDVLDRKPGMAADEGGARAGLHLEYQVAETSDYRHFLVFQVGGQGGLVGRPGYNNAGVANFQARVGYRAKRTLSVKPFEP